MADIVSFGVGVYQHLPEKIDPIAFSVGSFNIRWYALMYILGFLAVYGLLLYRIKNKEFSIFNFQFSSNFQLSNAQLKNFIFDLLVYLFFGLLIGGRLGYVLFYNFSYYASHPLAIISPFSSAGSLTGIYGMSYFGGLIGAVLAGYIFCKRKKIDFLKMADFIIPAIPAGYFFGRIGNFLNGELYGRATDMPWGMYFSDGILRHPAQLYEAFFEGLVLFIILWALRNANCHSELDSGSKKGSEIAQGIRFRIKSGMTEKGQLLIIYLLGYGLFRFFIEFFREPDEQSRVFFNFLTLGQIFSLSLIVISAVIFFKYAKFKHSD